MMLGLAVAILQLAGRAGEAVTGEALLLLGVAALTTMLIRGHYRVTIRASVLDMLFATLRALGSAATLVIAGIAVAGAEPAAAQALVLTASVACVCVCAGRTVLYLLQRRALVRHSVGKRTLIVGAGIVGTDIAHQLDSHPEYGLTPIGLLDAAPREQDAGRRVPLLGSPDRLLEVATGVAAEHVLIAFSSAGDAGMVPLVRQCEEAGLEVSLVPRFFESINERFQLERLGTLPVLRLQTVDLRGWRFNVKYALDRTVAATAIVGLSPLLFLIACSVKLTSRGPVLFRQRRIGRDGHVFDLLKFRSMQVEREGDAAFRPEEGHAPGGIEGVDRRTAVGRVLRRTFLDELPQLINVVRGDMSLIGPRPERPEFVELFDTTVERYHERHRVKSGMTGWAQVCGLRGQTSLVDRIRADNYYIENWSAWLDLKILILTVAAVLTNDAEA